MFIHLKFLGAIASCLLALFNVIAAVDCSSHKCNELGIRVNWLSAGAFLVGFSSLVGMCIHEYNESLSSIEQKHGTVLPFASQTQQLEQELKEDYWS